MARSLPAPERKPILWVFAVSDLKGTRFTTAAAEDAATARRDAARRLGVPTCEVIVKRERPLGSGT